MTKLILTLGFKQCKSDAGIYYFINEKTRELVIAIIYVDDVYFKRFSAFLRVKAKIYDKIEMP